MYRLLLSFLALAATATFFACDDDDNNCQLEDVATPFVAPCRLSSDLDTIKMLVEGEWTWVQEHRPRLGASTLFLTPKTEGYSRKLVLKDGKATYYKCGQKEDTFRYVVVRQEEVYSTPGYDFPDDEWPVIAFYNIETGQYVSYVPLRICNDYLIFQYQYVRSIAGEYTWRRAD